MSQKEAEAPKSVDMEEVKKRAEKFVEGYKKLVEEFDIDFASYPNFVPNERGTFDIVVQSIPVDVTNRPKPSPFIEKE